MQYVTIAFFLRWLFNNDTSYAEGTFQRKGNYQQELETKEKWYW